MLGLKEKGPAKKQAMDFVNIEELLKEAEDYGRVCVFPSVYEKGKYSVQAIGRAKDLASQVKGFQC